MFIERIPSRDDLSSDIHLPLVFVTDEENAYEIKSWSLDSIVRPEGLTHTAIRGLLDLNFQGFSVALPVSLAPGVDPDRLDFVDLDTRQTELLRTFYRGVISGEMEAVDNVIVAMDMPVRDVPMHETKEDQAAAPKVMHRWLRAGLSLTIYLCIALLVFGSLAFTAWERWNFVDMSNARLVTGDTGLAVQGWLNDDDITDTWVGMPAEGRVNIDGEVVVLPGRILKMQAGSEAGVQAREGYLVQVELASDLPADTEVLTSGTPVDVILDRQLLARILP